MDGYIFVAFVRTLHVLEPEVEREEGRSGEGFSQPLNTSAI